MALRGLHDLVDDQLYTAREVAGLLRLRRDAVYQMVRDGKLASAARPGGRHRFLGADVKRLFDARRVNALPGPTETRAERERRADEDRERFREVMRRRLKAV